MNPRVTISFSRLNDPALQAKAEAIVAAMTDNANFPNPSPLPAEVRAAITAYSTALAAARNGSRTDIAIKDQKREELIEMLMQLGSYVNYTAGDDYAALVSSNFDLSKNRESAPPLPNPENFMLEEGLNPGEVLASVRGVRGAKAYLFQYTTTDPTQANAAWTIRTSTSRKCTLTGLQSGQRYWVRVVVLGSYAQETYSEVLSRIVQ